MYKEMSKDAFKHHDKWIIAFCPDTDSFFATDDRCYYWDTEGKLEFNSEIEAINYFESHLEYFLNINNELMQDFFYGNIFKNNNIIIFENTGEKYRV